MGVWPHGRSFTCDVSSSRRNSSSKAAAPSSSPLVKRIYFYFCEFTRARRYFNVAWARALDNLYAAAAVSTRKSEKFSLSTLCFERKYRFLGVCVWRRCLLLRTTTAKAAATPTAAAAARVVALTLFQLFLSFIYVDIHVLSSPFFVRYLLLRQNFSLLLRLWWW